MQPLALDHVTGTVAGRVRWGAHGEGPPVVLVHGTPFSSAVWADLGRHLARHHRVYLYDMPGYGSSEMRAGQDVSLGIQNRVLAELLRAWGLECPAVIAHDFGGATALRAHLIDGCEYDRLMLLDPVALAPWGSPFVQHVRRHEEAFAGLPASMHRALVDAYVRGAMHRPPPPGAMDLLLAPWCSGRGQAAFYRQIAQMDPRWTNEVEARYAEVRCPVTILWGECDAWLPVAMAQRLGEVVGSDSVHVIPDAGHLIQVDATLAVAAHAEAFLAAGHGLSEERPDGARGRRPPAAGIPPGSPGRASRSSVSRRTGSARSR